MKLISNNSQFEKYKMPGVICRSFFDDQMMVCVRPWTFLKNENIVFNEIEQFLTANDVDVEITTPFDYVDSLSSMANKVRISVLMANDRMYLENKDQYQNAYEVAMMFKYKNELILSSLGRFNWSIQYSTDEIYEVYGYQGILDKDVLLPGNILGLNKDPFVQVISLKSNNITKITLSSTFNKENYNELVFKF